MSASQTIELAPASPGRHSVRVASGLDKDWKRVVIRAENAEGESVEVELTREQAMNFAGSVQGYACILR